MAVLVATVATELKVTSWCTCSVHKDATLRSVSVSLCTLHVHEFTSVLTQIWCTFSALCATFSSGSAVSLHGTLDKTYI